MIYILITLSVMTTLISLYAIGEFVVWIATDFR